MIGDASEQTSESWIGLDSLDNEYLIKLWPFLADEANDVQRVLWDSELRTMYRVGSSPGAEKAVVVIREAGLDLTHKCFVMVSIAGSSGYIVLREALKNRAQYSWLSSGGVDARRKLFTGLRHIAQGIQILHTQFVLHSNVSAENVFFKPENGPESFRLAGFEWSVRIGELRLSQPAVGWATPPELSESASFGYQPETDWYGFGMLAARCLLNIEAYRSLTSAERHLRVLRTIEAATGPNLSDIERKFLERLLDRKHRDRLMRGYEITSALDELLRSLQRSGTPSPDPIRNPLILAYNPVLISDEDQESFQSAGFIANPDKPSEAWNPYDIVHTGT